MWSDEVVSNKVWKAPASVSGPLAYSTQDRHPGVPDTQLMIVLAHVSFERPENGHRLVEGSHRSDRIDDDM